MISADGLMLAMDGASGRGSEPVTTLSHPLITLQTQVAVIEQFIDVIVIASLHSVFNHQVSVILRLLHES